MSERLDDTALAVMHMQPEVCKAAAEPRTVEVICGQIRLFRAARRPILLVQLPPLHFGPTHSTIMEEIAGYEELYHLENIGYSAAKELTLAVQVLEFKKLRITGVNSDSCIAETVGQLNLFWPIHKLEEVQVLQAGCNTDVNPQDPWRWFPKSKLIKLI